MERARFDFVQKFTNATVYREASVYALTEEEARAFLDGNPWKWNACDFSEEGPENGFAHEVELEEVAAE